MNIYNDYRQRIIIDMIRMGNTYLREDFFWYCYNKVIKALEKYNIPSDIFPDVASEVAICVLDMLDNYDFSEITSVAVTIRQKAFNAVIDYLYTIYDYQMIYNNRVYKNAGRYYMVKYGYSSSPSVVLGELLKSGKRKDNTIEDIATSDDYMEDFLTNKMIEKRYFEIMQQENPNYQTIMLGKMPIHSALAENDLDIMQTTGYSRANIYLVIKKLKEHLGLDSKLASLLDISEEQRLSLIRSRYNEK